MSKSIVAEGKTTSEAIEKGLKELNTTKDKVDIKILDNEEKRSFFSILAPRIVKVELTIKDGVEKKENRYSEISDVDIKEGKENAKIFLESFLNKVSKNCKYEIEENNEGIKIEIRSENLGFLIGYRGETLYSLQTVISAIANKNLKNKIRVTLDIEGYKEKREKTLQNLAVKLANTVVKTKKSITLEPMSAYERKIIHSKLQENSKVTTKSIGEEPRRRIVISLK